MRSTWRAPDDLEHWLDDDNIEDELWRAHPRR
jgi:hypothetical protein